MNSILAISLYLFSLIWGTNLEHALAQSKQRNTYVLLYFSGSDWCGPCITLKKNIFDAPEFEAFAQNNLELVRADFPRLKKNQLPKEQSQYNEKLAEKYNSQGKFPFTLLLDKEGKIVYQWDGYPKNLTAKQMVETLKEHVLF